MARTTLASARRMALSAICSTLMPNSVGERRERRARRRRRRAACDRRGRTAARIVPRMHVRVGDGRRGAAATVAGGTGIGAAGARPDAQHAAGVAPDDAAAAGADRRDVDDRRADRQAVDARLRRDDRLAVGDQADVGAGAAHVEGDQVVAIRSADLADRTHDAGGRAGEQRGDGVAPDRACRQAPAVRLHDAETARETVRWQAASSKRPR